MPKQRNVGGNRSVPSSPGGGKAASKHNMIERFACGPLRRRIGVMLSVSDLMRTRATSRLASGRWRCGVVRARLAEHADVVEAFTFIWPDRVVINWEHVMQLSKAVESPVDVLSSTRHPLLSALQAITSLKIVGAMSPEGSIPLVALLPHLKSLNDLDVSCQRSAGSHATGLILRQMKVLSILNMHGASFGTEGCILLAAALPLMPLLSELLICDNDIGQEGCIALAAVLPQMKMLSNLDICCNYIGDEGCIALAAVLPQMKLLTELGMTTNEIHDKGMAALAAVLPQTKLSTLRIALNGDDDSLDALVEVGEDCGCLVDIDKDC